jgi:drug/metabolite transporter (DMT)-like permease
MIQILDSWIFFALLAPLLWAFTNFIDKYAIEKYTKNAHDFIFFCSFLDWIFFVVLFLNFGLPEFTLFWFVPIIIGMLYTSADWFYSKALRVTETSQVIISFKLVPVFTLLFGFFFLNQKISSIDTIAFAIVILGSLFISLEKVEGIFKITQGTKWIISAIIIWASIMVGIDWILAKILFWQYLTLETLGKGIAGTSLIVLPKTRNDLVDSIKKATIGKYFCFSLSGCLNFCGEFFVKKALLLGSSAGLVTVVTQIQSVYGVIIGVILTLCFPHLIQEDISKENIIKKILGILIMFIGIYLLIL